MTSIATKITKTIPLLTPTLTAPVLITIIIAGVHYKQVPYLLVEAPKIIETLLVKAIIMLVIALVVV